MILDHTVRPEPETALERTVDAHIKNLRAKLEPDPRHPKYIETVFGVGYRFHKD